MNVEHSREGQQTFLEQRCLLVYDGSLPDKYFFFGKKLNRTWASSQTFDKIYLLPSEVVMPKEKPHFKFTAAVFTHYCTSPSCQG